MRLISVFFLILAILNYKLISRIDQFITVDTISTNKKEISNSEKQVWYVKDITLDSIPGISLERAYSELLKEKKGDDVILAVIDSELDINHKDIKSNLWINNDIPNNGIDDDKNGYVDDVHGWNFLANKNGEYTTFYHYEVTRILKRDDSIFKDKNENQIPTTLKKKYTQYLKAKKEYQKQLEVAIGNKNHGNYLAENYDKAFALVKQYYPENNYTVKNLDSLYNALKEKEKDKANLVYYVLDCKRYNLTRKWVKDFKANADALVDKTLNVNFNERHITKDNPNDINDTTYGSPKILNSLDMTYHATQVAGILTRPYKNPNFKIMPIIISAHGEEHDKDIALAIKYAVDNGAKIINMSIGKGFSLQEKWILDAILYASENNVLIVCAAGNTSLNVDNIDNKYFPNDIDEDGNEVSNNFISVGASTNSISENLIASFSNYNKEHVDIFAPGSDIFVASPVGNEYYNSGTSLAAPMVTNVAALIMSYHPNLSASEVKNIILASGVSYDIMVNKPSTNKEKEKVPFSSLSKSGKIVNAYNALLLAEQVSKKKKRN